MKKLIIMIILISCVFPLVTGCSKSKYEFNQSIDNIEKVEIAIIGELKSLYAEREFILIKEIPSDKIDGFINDFREIDCFKKVGDPSRLYSGETAFKITYANGVYEFIIQDAQGKYEDGKSLNTGYYRFDEKQFNDLIEKYSN